METPPAVRQRKHTRVLTACHACRLSKTRCDSARPECAKCIQRGVACEYPDKDAISVLVSNQKCPFHFVHIPKPPNQSIGHLITSDIIFRLEAWGARILDAVERQERLLSENLTASKAQTFPVQQASPSSVEDVDPESISRNDAPKTPITGSDMILSWPIFPKDKPVSTFPISAHSEKPDRFQTGTTQASSFFHALCLATQD